MARSPRSKSKRRAPHPPEGLPPGEKREPRPRPSRHPWLAPAALILLTALVYARSLAVPILDWDDHVYLFRDARLENLSWENLWKILTQPFFANFHPLTTLTYAFDRAVWKTWVPGFHITQLAFYVGGILGLYWLFARVLGSRAGAFAAAAIFATHTIHVESVAWLASRKDVVCLFFYAFTLLAYARYAGSQKSRVGPYAITLLLAAAAMFSKGYAVVLPAVMLAYDLCFTGRVGRRQILDKLPFLALAAATALLTVHAQDRDSTLIQSAMTGERRVALLAKVFALYAGHALLPVNPSAFYTIAGERIGSAAQLGALLAVALLAGFVFLRRKLPAAAFGIALYLLPLGTVMNFFFTLRIWMADRYLLFPTIGSSLTLVALAMSLRPRRGATPARSGVIRRVLVVSAVLAIGIYSALTLARVELWTSRVHLWSDTVREELHLAGSGPVTAGELSRVTNLRSTPSTPVINLIGAYEAAGDAAQAREIAALLGEGAGGSDLEREMGLARQDLDEGRAQEALLRLRPIAEGKTWMAPPATIWMGAALDQLGDAEASQRTLQRGIELYRKSGQLATDALFMIGAREFNKGNYLKSAEWFRLAHQESTREAKAAFLLARALAQGGNPTEAMRIYRRIASGELPIASTSQFTEVDLILQMGAAEQKLGHAREAIAHYEEVLRRSPRHEDRESILAAIAALRGAPAR